jgi:Domain of unknown function (DUF4407)
MLELLLIISGVNRAYLKECPSESTKYAGIGATILLTAVFATVSGSYFLTFAFSNKKSGQLDIPLYVIISFGILWGLMILNLDRNIIVSIKKTGNFWEELKQTFFRFVLAIFIGIVIATPLELKLFEDEVNVKIAENVKEIKAYNHKKDIAIYQPDIDRVEQEINQLLLSTKAKEIRKNILYDSLMVEAQGTGGSFRRGLGKLYEEKKIAYENAQSDYDSTNLALKARLNQRDEIVAKVNSNTELTNAVIENMDGPEARVKALYQLSGLHWFITVLFILIEVTPILTKLMSKRGAYDEIMERVEYENSVRQKKIISEINDDINHSINQSTKANILKSEYFELSEKNRQEKEYSTTNEIIDKIAQKQLTLAEDMIEKWYLEEKNKLEY